MFVRVLQHFCWTTSCWRHFEHIRWCLWPRLPKSPPGIKKNRAIEETNANCWTVGHPEFWSFCQFRYLFKFVDYFNMPFESELVWRCWRRVQLKKPAPHSHRSKARSPSVVPQSFLEKGSSRRVASWSWWVPAGFQSQTTSNRNQRCHHLTWNKCGNNGRLQV